MTTNLLTTAQAAARLNVTPGRVRRLVMDGRLTPALRGRDLYFSTSDIDSFVKLPVGNPNFKRRTELQQEKKSRKKREKNR